MPSAVPRSILVEQQVRPLRLAILVDPGEPTSFLRAVELLTAQWGGMYSFVLPTFARRPPWWDDVDARLSAVDILTRWLDHIDPDAVIDVCDRATPPAPAQRYPRLTADELQPPAKDADSARGVGADVIYADVARQRALQPPSLAMQPVVPPQGDDPSLDPLVASCIGRFSDQPGYGHLATAYQRTFEPSRLPLTPRFLFQLSAPRLRSAHHSPLTVASVGLRYWRPRGADEPVAFLLNPESVTDLTDFWNLRALGYPILPVPTSWLEELIEPLVRLARSRPEDPALTLAASRRASSEDIEAARERLAAESVAVWLNPGLLHWASMGTGAEDQVGAFSAQKVSQEDLVGGRLVMPLLQPEFASEDLERSEMSWANVVRLRPPSWSELSGVVPRELDEVSVLLNSRRHLRVRARREGLVMFAGWEDQIDWRPPSGAEVFRELASTRGLDAELSTAGRIALEISRRTRGLLGVNLLRSRPLIDVFNRAARADFELAGESEQRRRRIRPIPRAELWRVLRESCGNDSERAKRRLRALVDHQIVRAEAMVSCPHCAQANWFPPAELDDSLTCRICLESFPFPHHEPPGQPDWFYRTIGGVHLPDHAFGSYTVLLSLRLLTADGLESVAWAPSMDLGDQLEVDFALLQQDRHAVDAYGRELLLLGECKSDNEFDSDDYERARILSRKFPEAILVFATLRSSLEPDERDAISRLARPDIRRWSSIPWEPRVMVLTGHELFGDRLPDAWKEAGGEIAKLAPSRLPGHQPEAVSIAELTQRMHLGLSTHREWLEQITRRVRPSKRRRPRPSGGRPG